MKGIETKKINRIGNLYGDKFGTSYAGNVYETDGLIHCINTAGGGNRMPLIVEYGEVNKSDRE